LVVNTSTSLGTGPLVLGSDTPQPGSSVAAGANFITLANPFTVAAQGSTINGNNTFILAGKGTLNGTLTVSNAASTVGLTGGLSGSGGLTRGNQSGTLVLGGPNTYTGPTSVGGGFLQLNATSALPSGSAVSVASGATLLFNNFDQTIASLAGAGAVDLGGANLTTGGNNSSTTFSGTITNGGGLTKVGTGTFTLSGFAGTMLTINAGTVQQGAALAVNGNVAVIVSSGPTFDLNNFSTNIGSRAGAGNVTLGSGAGATLSTGQNNSSTTFSGVLSGNGAPLTTGSSPTGLLKSGTGTFTISGANTYSGGTIVNGTLQLGAANAIPSTSSVLVTTSSTLDLNGFNLTIASLAGGQASPPGLAMVKLGSGTLITDGSGLQSLFVGIISGTGGLTKVGPGTLLLIGNSTYTGQTTISQGTLQISGRLVGSVTVNSSLASNVTVSSGA